MNFLFPTIALLLGTSRGDVSMDHSIEAYAIRLPNLASLLTANCSVENQPIEVWERRLLGKKLVHNWDSDPWYRVIDPNSSCVYTPKFPLLRDIICDKLNSEGGLR
jgi:hypothetical protein